MEQITLADKITELTGSRIQKIATLSGGCVADVVRAELENGQSLVIKQDDANRSGLLIEAEMLRYFAQHSPITCPEVIYADDGFLIMSFIANDNHMNHSVQIDLAEQLTKQHMVISDQFGLSFDTLIGGLYQPNQLETSWIRFFGEHRLRFMGHAAHKEGRMNAAMTTRMDRLIDRLDQYINDQPKASLLHGDLWGGNILCQGGKLAGLIDPAIYYGDRETELAFGTLFGDLKPEFFARYNEIMPIDAGFFEERRDLYNLYPLLVHVRLFGGSYIGSVDHILSRFGY